MATVLSAKIENKLKKARASLVLDNPFFGTLSLRLKLVEMPEVKRLAVDGRHIFYNAQFVDSMSFAVTRTAMAHEVMHCVWNHMARLGNRKPKIWNMAGDYVINDMLKTMKDKHDDNMFEIGDDWLWDKRFTGPQWSADKVYNELIEKPPCKGMGGDDDPDGMCVIMPAPMGGSGKGDEDGDGPSIMVTADEGQMAREWKIAAIQAANAAKMQGSLPADLERFIHGLTKPQINWREILRNFINEVTKNDYNWTRPNRRFEHLYLPSLHDESLGEIAVVIDDSGSINQNMLNVFGSEVKGIMEDARPSKLHLIYCDAAVSAHYELRHDEEPVFKIHGGGGTCFKPPFIMLQEKEIEPKCLVYLTDLYGDFGEEPAYPVLWASISPDQTAPWGTTLYIEEIAETEKE